MRMKTNLRIKCPRCGYLNTISVRKVFFEPKNPESKVRIMIPMYQPLEMSKCKKCGKILTEPNTFIRIFQGKIEYWKETQ